jgi:trans-2,3-dihydro-3-hydroxyanthranilate isomerase
VVGAALGADAVTLETGAGLVPIALERDGDRIVFGRMRQPIPGWERYEGAAELFAALGVQVGGSALIVAEGRFRVAPA